MDFLEQIPEHLDDPDLVDAILKYNRLLVSLLGVAFYCDKEIKKAKKKRKRKECWV